MTIANLYDDPRQRPEHFSRPTSSTPRYHIIRSPSIVCCSCDAAYHCQQDYKIKSDHQFDVLGVVLLVTSGSKCLCSRDRVIKEMLVDLGTDVGGRLAGPVCQTTLPPSSAAESQCSPAKSSAERIML